MKIPMPLVIGLFLAGSCFFEGLTAVVLSVTPLQLYEVCVSSIFVGIVTYLIFSLVALAKETGEKIASIGEDYFGTEK